MDTCKNCGKKVEFDIVKEPILDDEGEEVSKVFSVCPKCGDKVYRFIEDASAYQVTGRQR